MNFNISHSLTESAARAGDRVGLIEVVSGKQISFTELARRSDAYAHILTRKGVVPGSKVMLMVNPSVDFICLSFALFKIGAPVILIDPGMGYKNLLRCIEGVHPDVFIGIPKAYLFRLVFRKPFTSVTHNFCCGSSMGLLGPDIRKQADKDFGPYQANEGAEDDLAAIIFTTGSTGPPKGVRYEHGVFRAQLQLIRDYYGISAGDVDQPAFPLFALFSTALGATAVIPDMDPSRPAHVDPEKFVNSIQKYGVTYSFGSPAIWNVIAGYCDKRDNRLRTVKKILMAGAPVSGGLIERMQNVLPKSSSIHTPYGATESLPIVSIEGREITEQTWELSRLGKGTCVGRALPGIEIAVIAVTDQIIPQLYRDTFLGPYEIGEIIVRGAVVTRAYENNEQETLMAKIPDGHTFWHRMGDVGYLDSDNRLWFCGRRAHCVITYESGRKKTLYPIPCEAIVNEHPEVFRSALVGVPDSLHKVVPVIIIEPVKGCTMDPTILLQEIERIVRKSPLTENIQRFLIHPDFPVDIRHNAKIFREKLSVWAANQLGGSA